MQVFISPQKKALSLALKNNPTHIISISDPGVDTPFDSGWEKSKVLSLKFFDLTDFSKAKVADQEKIPNKKIVEQIYNFGKDFEDDSIILIHCFAGISRSAAAGIISLTSSYGALGAAKRIGELNIDGESGYTRFYPNDIMISILDDMLHFDGDLYDLVGEQFFKQKE
jgi:predicted protein tyrosine phosphatase